MEIKHIIVTSELQQACDARVGMMRTAYEQDPREWITKIEELNEQIASAVSTQIAGDRK